MAIINILPNGTTSGNPSIGNLRPPKRRDTVGWSHSVSKRLRKWLYSIPIKTLDGHGYSFTLTVRDCPATSEDWAKARDKYLKRLFRDGCTRVQWITEWQARGVPHLHGIAYFEDEYSTGSIIEHWLSVSSQKYGAGKSAQDSKPIHNVVGWLNYLAKHAARSATHYQRSPENVPVGWDKTGRVWGYRGHWDITQSMRFEVDQEGFYVYRRIVKGIHHSKVRDRYLKLLSLEENVLWEVHPYMRNGKLIESTPTKLRKWFYSYWNRRRSTAIEFRRSRSSLKSNNSNIGRMSGTSDWIDQDTASIILVWIGSQGYQVVQDEK